MPDLRSRHAADPTISNVAPRRVARSTQVTSALIGAALGMAALAAMVALLAGPAYRLQWLTLAGAFGALRWATYGALAGAAVAVLALGLMPWRTAPRGRTSWFAAVALAINAAIAGVPLYHYWQAQTLPKIHDISTDTADPPAFIAVLPLRQGARNPVDYLAQTATEQRRGYPDIEPRLLALPPPQAFERALRTARALRWEIVAVDADALRIEATDSTWFFGFKDDVVIRVRAQGPGSVVDMRSLSRIGGSDVGANARRVRSFLDRLAEG